MGWKTDGYLLFVHLINLMKISQKIIQQQFLENSFCPGY